MIFQPFYFLTSGSQPPGDVGHSDDSGSSAAAPFPSPNSRPSSNVRRLYFCGFGLVYLIAFLSLWSQIHALVGENGLLPASVQLKLAYERLGTAAYRFLPTLCWLGSNDWMLHVWCGLGVVLSVCMIAGFALRLVLVLLWVVYLSLSVAGQDFLSFQWDTLLLEMTICSLFYAPRGLRPDWNGPIGSIACWPLWFLAFKLMFLSGATKLLSGDSSWWDGTALQFHYYTQPIPSWPAWYAYQCPLALHQVALSVLFVVELLLPFLVFTGRRGRAIFGLASIGLMIAIEATGNFGFFNLQTIVLCLPLLNDDLVKRCIPRGGQIVETTPMPLCSSPKCGIISGTILLFISLLTIVNEMSLTAQGGKMPGVVMAPIDFADRLLLSWGKPWVLKPLSPFCTINGYGLFRVMTTRRNEIVLEMSDDKTDWTACEFPYKPGSMDRAPPIVAPHMPRLDWQMWFAALNPRGHEHWLSVLMRKVLEGDPSVARLMSKPELIANPPKFVRLAMYEYKFTSIDQRAATGRWWNRTFIGNLTDAIER